MNAFKIKGKPVGVDYHSDPGNKVFDDPELTIDLIDKEMQYDNEYGSSVYPGIVINNQTFRGTIEVEAVFSAICAGFKDTPDFCKKYVETKNFNDIDLVLMNNIEARHSATLVITLIFSMVFCFIFMAYCYRRHAKRQMKIELKT